MVSRQSGSRPDATIVIVDRDEPQLTLESVRSILSQQGASFEVLVVSTSESACAGQPASDLADVRVIRPLAGADPLAGACAGIVAATGRAIVLLDNRTRLRAGALAALLAPLAEPRVGAVIPLRLLQATDPVIVSSTGAEVTRSGDRRDRDWGLPLEDLERPAGPAMAFSSAAVALRREAVADVGGWFDPARFSYYEDIELAFRLRRRGWEIRYAPNSVVQHRLAPAPWEGSTARLASYETDRLRFAIVHGTPGVSFRRVGRTFAGAWFLLLRGDASGFGRRLRSLGQALRDVVGLRGRRRELMRSATVPLSAVWSDGPTN